MAFTVLNRHGAAVIIELMDLPIAVMIFESGLIMTIFNIQCSACRAAILFRNSDNAVRLAGPGSVIGILQPISRCIRHFI